MSTADTTTSTLDRNRAVATEYFTAIHERDMDRMLACWSRGGIEAVPGARNLEAPAGVHDFFTQFFNAFQDWKLEILDVTCEGDVAIVHWRLTAGFTGPGTFDGFVATGARGTIQGLDRFEIQAGKIVRNDAYFDTTEMAREIGLMPPAGSGPDKGMTAMVNLQTRTKRLLKRS
ncbi:MAG: hypothetical protein QOF76_2482 [Solirubrobacteraceae bacterium]|jgi:ketosteroid isomerase-like protein|nr:hypothetical protein [Solirubrobacteraceae bacterium]